MSNIILHKSVPVKYYFERLIEIFLNTNEGNACKCNTESAVQQLFILKGFYCFNFQLIGL